jgi:uncharacterized membrane protein YdfJ with MMPL/SSD domain
MTGVLYKLARFSVRHRFAVVAVWLLLAVVLVGEVEEGNCGSRQHPRARG